MIVDGIEYCDKCESIIPTDRLYQDNALDITLTGGYGMFMDLLTVELIFCHSCAVEFFRTIPMLSADKMNGLHSVSIHNEDYPLCCEYSWTFDENAKRDENGKIEVIYGTKEHFDKGRK